jgi:chemotaxis methyl-accepting protein methylase
MKLNHINMKNLGLTEKLIQESKLYKDLFIGRVSAQYKNVYLCRNVLIYFNKSLQMKVYELFNESLGMLGILGLGDKETIHYTDIEDCYEGISEKHKIYKKNQMNIIL